jgi:catalase
MLTPRQKKYLAQIYNISPDYSQGVYTLLADPGFSLDEVKELSETAQEWYKEKKFQPSTGEKLTGFVPGMPIYN